MWEKPWKWKEHFLIGAGLVIIGLLLQITVGGINWKMFSFPSNLIALVVYIAILLIINALRNKVYLFEALSTSYSAVAAISWTLLLTVLMGLIGQDENFKQTAWPGFTQMLSTWWFVLVYCWLITILGLTAIRRTLPFKVKNIPFLLNHWGFFIAIVCATLGHSDVKNLTMTTRLKQVEWRAEDENTKQVYELPFAIDLQKFTMDEYAPKLMLINNETGNPSKKGRAEAFMIEEGSKSAQHGTLGDWNISVLKSFAFSAPIIGKTPAEYVEWPSEGAVHSAQILAVNSVTGAHLGGWVSNGSFMFKYNALKLDDSSSIVLTDPDPKRYASEVKVLTKDGDNFNAVIEVNNPLKVEGWKVYQYDYDEDKGRWSTTSVFNVVKDPWLPFVYVGLWLMVAGAALMLFGIGKRKKSDESNADLKNKED